MVTEDFGHHCVFRDYTKYCKNRVIVSDIRNYCTAPADETFNLLYHMWSRHFVVLTVTRVAKVIKGKKLNEYNILKNLNFIALKTNLY